MVHVKMMTFNAFQENTYIVYNNEKEAIIFDPGCSNLQEKEALSSFINSNNLIPTRLVNTHCHIDHVLGNQFIAKTYKLKLEASEKELVVLNSCNAVSNMYGIPYETSPDISSFIEEGDDFKLGEETFEILHCPGHSPGSLCFYHIESKILIGGDVLFLGSIGRTDLPGGDHQTLIQAIKTKIFKLPEDTTVYPGHGPKTSVGIEKASNPFLT